MTFLIILVHLLGIIPGTLLAYPHVLGDDADVDYEEKLEAGLLSLGIGIFWPVALVVVGVVWAADWLGAKHG
jgi:hypothetical protein